MRLSNTPAIALLSAVAMLASSVPVVAFQGGDEFEKEPILYSTSTPRNRVEALKIAIESGNKTIRNSPRFGYLPDLLNALEVPDESQTLVFSKTSLQMRRISPRTPRAIYFSDDVYIGFCQSGDVLEISAVDPELGTVFYTVDQHTPDQPIIQRQTESCLVCHSSSRMEGVPGHIIRSLYVDAGGQPLLSAGSRTVDHTTPVKDRWGGWYVTGTHGAQTHLGNLVIRDRDVVEPVDNSEGQNVTDLKFRINPDRYLSPHSDIVALMVLEHQVLVHNRITKASFETRQALAYDEMMRKMMDKPEGELLENTTRRIQTVSERLVDALLFVNEAKLTEPFRGTSGYAEQFVGLGPRDSQGRSLRDLDLSTRMLKYPCSYLIYSEAFDQLPKASKDCVLRKLWDVLSGTDVSEKYSHLSPDDRRAIREILLQTKSDLPDDWKS
ncbi:MAG: hypothetical protein JNL58_03690 [Planctomyces sp.]|nr:hypothetical protein [Planctomyces sp.]